MSSRNRVPAYLVALVAGLAFAGYVFYTQVLVPMSREARDLSQRLDLVSRKIETLAQKGETLAHLRAEYEQALKSIQEIDSTVTREMGIPYFLRDLEKVSSTSGTTVVSLSLGSPAASSPYAELPLTIEVEGSYQQMRSFLHELLSLGRAISVKALRLGAQRGVGDSDKAQVLNATFSMVLYVVPKGGDGK